MPYRIDDHRSHTCDTEQEEIVSVVVIFLMFSAVIVMVKNVDRDRETHATLAPDSSEKKPGIDP